MIVHLHVPISGSQLSLYTPVVWGDFENLAARTPLFSVSLRLLGVRPGCELFFFLSSPGDLGCCPS